MDEPEVVVGSGDVEEDDVMEVLEAMEEHEAMEESETLEKSETLEESETFEESEVVEDPEVLEEPEVVVEPQIMVGPKVMEGPEAMVVVGQRARERDDENAIMAHETRSYHIQALHISLHMTQSQVIYAENYKSEPIFC